MESGPFEDVFAIEHGDIPASYVSLPEGTAKKNYIPKCSAARFKKVTGTWTICIGVIRLLQFGTQDASVQSFVFAQLFLVLFQSWWY